MTKKSAHEILETVFDVVVKEAKDNPKFAKKVLDILPDDEEILTATKKAPRKRKEKLLDVDQYHAVNILRRFGEGVLEGKLNEVKKDDLRRVASFSGLKLTGPAAKKTATKAVIIEGIIQAAKRYIEQRNVAAA
ncbi:MAG: hypothetical protein ACRBBN_18135 [Methyloligellaceae bacterium]